LFLSIFLHLFSISFVHLLYNSIAFRFSFTWNIFVKPSIYGDISVDEMAKASANLVILN
jgi:hypothetical protein